LKILCVAATKIEIGSLIRCFEDAGEYASVGDLRFRREGLEVDVLMTGVGLVPALYFVTRQLKMETYDLLLNIGIAGSFYPQLETGDVVRVVEDNFADMGAQDDAGFYSMFQAGFWNKDERPFSNGRLIPQVDMRWTGGLESLAQVKGLTVQNVSGDPVHTREKLERYGADVETMEGAAFFYVALMENKPAIQVRAISNMVGDRDAAGWDIPVATQNLADAVFRYLQSLKAGPVNSGTK